MASPQTENGFTRVANELLEKVYETAFTSIQFKLIFWVIRHSYGFHKKTAKMGGIRAMGRVLKISHAAVLKAIKTLIKAGVLVQENDQISLVKDFEKWSEGRLEVVTPVTRVVTPVTTNGNARNQKSLDINNVVNKEIINKSFQEGVPPTTRRSTPQVTFVNAFKAAYESMTQQPFKPKRCHYIIAAALLKDYGLEVAIGKAYILGRLCLDRSAWFTKAGWADFSIETLSAHWNAILDDRVQTKNDEFIADLKKVEAENERLNRSINRR